MKNQTFFLYCTVYSIRNHTEYLFTSICIEFDTDCIFVKKVEDGKERLSSYDFKSVKFSSN